MFDQLGWRWEYEPLDLTGYIPDFVLVFPAGQVLVEVKPKFTVDALIDAAWRKIDQSGWASREDGYPNDALIVGATCQPHDEDVNPIYGVIAIGAVRQLVDAPPDSAYVKEAAWDAGCWHTCLACQRPSFHHYTHEQCSVCGAYADDGLRGKPPDVAAMWAEAVNAVQWRSPRQ